MRKSNKTKKVLLGVTAPIWIPVALALYLAMTPVVWMSVYNTQKRKRDAKPPEAEAGYRALSIDSTIVSHLADGSLREEIATKVRNSPTFFKLPRELRLAIYEEIIGKENIHIILIDGQLHSFRCKNKYCHNAEYGNNHCWIKDQRKFKTILDRQQYIYHDSGINILPLLQSCKAIYADTISILYSYPHFQTHNYDSLFALASTIPPGRFNTIRNLHIDARHKPNWGHSLFPRHFPIGLPSYRALRDLTILNPVLPEPVDPFDPLGAWALTCELISGMQGLKNLAIDMDYPNRQYIWEEREKKQNTVKRLERGLIGPMRSLQDMRLLVLKVRFEGLDSEAVHWLELPFVEAYPDVKEGDMGA